MNVFDRILKKKKAYDLNTAEGIESIEIPMYKPNKGIQSPVNNIEYILQRKATEHKRNGRMDLAIACLRKSNEIFLHSNFLWSVKDYMRLVEYLKQVGRFEEARIEEQKINDLFQQNDLAISALEKILLDCKSMGTDLVISPEISRACAECAKYARRIFSISGKDKRFPVLPAYFKLGLPEHGYCFNSFYPFVLRFSEPTWKYTGNLIEWCNRPYSDERTREQKQDFKNWIIKNKQEAIDRRNYDYLREHLLEMAPKSFSGFRRMKSQRSSNYLKLLEIAFEGRINLDETPDLSMFKF